MERDRADAARYLDARRRRPTPDTATWDAREDAEVELLGEPGSVDEVDLVDESWAPGQPPPGMPVEEVLHIHTLTECEPTADELDLDDLAHDRVEVTPDELFEGEEEED